MLYIIMAFFSGVLIMTAIAINSQFAKRHSMMQSLITNYLTGSVASFALLMLLGVNLTQLASIPNIPPLYLSGGVLGIVTTFFFNIIMPKLPAFYVVIIRFISQMVTSVILDYVIYQSFSAGKLIGALLFLAGLIYNTHIDQLNSKASSLRRFS